MKSMTGYGEASGQGSIAEVTVQVRTVNHRHLDIQLRVPRTYLAVEESIRQEIRRRVARGRVELFITRSLIKGKGRRLELDDVLLGQYLATLTQVKERFNLKGELELGLLARLPDLFEFKEDNESWHSEKRLVLKTAGHALSNLERSRAREGVHLKRDIQEQVRRLQRVRAGLSREAKKIHKSLIQPQEAREGEKPAEVQRPAREYDNSLPKGDIHEEVVRLHSHMEGLSKLLRERGPVGKKMDFLLQEAQRELSTIGAKASQLSTASLVLSGRESVEKIREQVQNVE